MSQQEEQPECPLCMEPFEVDDLNFFPCTCGYQICRFCWHRIRTDENGLCPACRKAYPENPADFKPLSKEQVSKMKAEKRHKEQQKKQKATESRKHLANVRVVQKNLVFVVGLPIRLADTHMLKKHEYFGKFGRIHKVVINQSTTYAGATGPSASAYVTYNRCDDALRAIQAVNNIVVDSRVLKTSLGTTKYCSHFIKSQTCPKPDCMYLHDFGDSEASFTKEEMQQGKHQEYERKLHEQLNSQGTVERKTVSPPQGGAKQEAWPSLNLNCTNGTAPLQSTPPLDTGDNTKLTLTTGQPTNTNNNNNSSNNNNNNNKNNKTRKDKSQLDKGKRKSKEKGEGNGLQTSQSESCISSHSSGKTANGHTNRTSILVETSSLYSNGFGLNGTGTKDSSPPPMSDPEPIEKAYIDPEDDSPEDSPSPASSDASYHQTRYQNGYQNGYHDDEDDVPVPDIIKDDELDFDPFQETQKGLADLLEKELLLEQKAAQEPPSYHNMEQNYYHPNNFMDHQLPNHTDPSILAHLHSNLQHRAPMNRGMERRPMPPPGFSSPQPPAHNQAGLYNRGVNPPNRMLPPFFYNLPSQCLQNLQSDNFLAGVPKLADWPESLRSLVHDSSTPPPPHPVHQQQHLHHPVHHQQQQQQNKGWSSPASNFADWTALDPAIVSSSRPQLLNMHSPPNLFSNQGMNPMNGTRVNMGGLGHSGQWSHRYHDNINLFKPLLQNSTEFFKTVPPPGFSMRHPSSDLKQNISNGIETME